MGRRLDAILISPYHGGSHRAWAEGWREHSRHRIRTIELPGQFWKWRLQGSAAVLRDRLEDAAESALPDLLIATSMCDLASLLGLAPRRLRGIPTVLYMHENQLTYPLPADPNTGPMRRQQGERDLHYALINYQAILAADQVVWNSEFHLDEYLRALPTFLGSWPDERQLPGAEEVLMKSCVLPPGIAPEVWSGREAAGTDRALSRLTIVWPHRWEYDKAPELFWRVLERLAADGLDFAVVVLGENHRVDPVEFQQARTWLGERLVRLGHAGREEYLSWLRRADLVVSTALHEYFGIAVVEAMAAGAAALVPDGLAYRETVPAAFRERCCYADEADLERRLRWAVGHADECRALGRELAAAAARYDWRELAPQYDRLLERLHEGQGMHALREHRLSAAVGRETEA